MGLKTSDDADDINLDLTLEKFSIARKFLSEILDVYIQEAERIVAFALIAVLAFWILRKKNLL